MKIPLTSPVRFKAKEYGRGWYPSSRQGWLVLLLMVLVIVGISYVMTTDPSQTSRGISRISVTLLLLITICYLTGEKPGWRWGNKSKV